MRNIILSILSGIFIILTISLLIDRLLVPTMENKAYVKEKLEIAAKLEEEYNKKLEAEKIRQDKVRNETVVVEYPENDQEIVGYVIGEYIASLSSRNYKKAYSLLYDGFKNQNFPNIESYKEYCINKYSIISNIDYLSSEKNKDVLIVQVQINFINGDILNQTFSIIKVAENDYKLSFGLGE